MLYSYIHTVVAASLGVGALTAPQTAVPTGLKKVLVIGMGAGMIPLYMLETIPGVEVTALELDSFVIEVCQHTKSRMIHIGA